MWFSVPPISWKKTLGVSKTRWRMALWATFSISGVSDGALFFVCQVMWRLISA
jgi:hypothetical protein